ncbi:hypothetical protein COV15_01685 [Candidatus Woesearchaeota archaeon CG10_big_fil_rev_8_21_14_0_10_34_12]|nr:MAG: hypothetical protein COV15_01685 [Candidatus Woesearchaeota archaeon CG10_big_fil_rev_8_21_14_0_10_34_12]
MAELNKRQTAYKLRIGDILKGRQEIKEDRLEFVESDNKRVVRVNLIANIVEKYESEGEKKFLSITLDDASGQIKVRVFGEDVDKYKEITQGNTVNVIGLLRIFNNEVYILAEIIKNIDPRYLLVRKLETFKETKAPIDVRDKILDKVKKSEPEGIDVERIILEMQEDAEFVNQEIKKILEAGLVYEPRPGRLRFLG